MNGMKPTSLLVSLLALGACAPSISAVGEGAAASAETTDDASHRFTGHWALGTLQSDIWIDEINMHADGTFEARVGDSVSNNSGFVSNVDGTYAFATSTSLLTLTYGGGSAEYSVKLSGNKQVATMAFIGDSDASNSFTMTQLPAPKVLEFTATSSPHDVALEVDTPIVIWYDAQRDSCPTSSTTRSPVTMLAAMDGNFGAQQVLQLPPTPVNGVYRALFGVPSGNSIAMWFQLSTEDSGGNTSCLHWDSNYEHNYVYDVATP